MRKWLKALARVVSGMAMLATPSVLTPGAGAQLAPLPVIIPQKVGDTLCGPVNAKPTGAHFSVALYGWMVGLNGQIGVRDLSADVNVRFTDILHKLRWGAMGTYEASYNSWLGIDDAVYASLRDKRTVSRTRLQPQLDLGLDLFIGNTFVGYTFRPEQNVAIDVLAGARFWHTDASLGISGDVVNRERERVSTWVDAIGGLRVRWQPARQWQVNIAGDGGAGGSKGTGEGLGSVSYNWTRWSAFAGYRYLYENYRKDEFFFTGHLDGPVLGGAYRF